MSEQRTGAQIMCEALIREDVEVMFGIPGGAIMPFYYAMVDYRDQLRHVLCRHEQGAGHAAEGYARSTGRLGVCIGTSGPGATNLVTPIADAWMDSTPLLAITGQVSSLVLGKDAFQETDITGITMPITKHNYLVKNVDELPYVFKEGIHIATTGRPGPVLIDVTKDTQQARTVPNWDIKLNLPGYRPTYHGNRKQIREAIRLLAEAKKPLIISGNGVIMSGAVAELRKMAERTRIPVITTLHGIGSFPEDHPLALGMPGMHGWVHINRAIQECDVLLNVGGRFDDRVTGKASTFAPKARVIHVDIDPSEIGKNVRVTVPIVGDGGFQMTNQELATVRQEGVRNVKVAVINNGYLGMVRQWQELFENKRYSGTPLSGPNFARLAEAYDIRGITVDDVSEVDLAVERAWEHDGPVVIDFRVEREVNVFPMVPQGKSIGEMI